MGTLGLIINLILFPILYLSIIRRSAALYVQMSVVVCCCVYVVLRNRNYSTTTRTIKIETHYSMSNNRSYIKYTIAGDVL